MDVFRWDSNAEIFQLFGLIFSYSDAENVETSALILPDSTVEYLQISELIISNLAAQVYCYFFDQIWLQILLNICIYFIRFSCWFFLYLNDWSHSTTEILKNFWIDFIKRFDMVDKNIQIFRIDFVRFSCSSIRMSLIKLD